MTRLAIDGGTPVRTAPFGPPWDLGSEEIANLVEVIESGVLVTDRFAWVARFEAELARLFGVRHALLCSSGTAACHIAVAMLDLEPGDEVISSGLGDVATVTGAVLQNLVPVFADVTSETATIDPVSIEARLTERTRALIPVHFLGQPADMTAVQEIAARHGLFVIEDCAQAMLSRRDGQLVGTIGTIGCFSLSNKLMLTGQGGLVVTDDDELAARGRLFRELFPRTSLQVPPAERLGTAYLMTDLEAAVGLAQLAKIGGYVRAQVAAAERLREMLAPLPGLRVLGDDPQSAPNRLFLAIRISPELLGPAAAFSAALKAEGVPHIYPYDLPIYRHPLFTERRTYGASGYPFTMDRPGGPADYTTVSLPVTEELVAETIVVRMSQAFSDGDVADIAAAISKVARGKASAAP